MEKVRNGEVVTQEEADSPVSGNTSTQTAPPTETVEMIVQWQPRHRHTTGCLCRWNYNRRRS